MKHTDEDIERVARAIGGEQDIPWFCFKDQAIAALDAMFAPDPAKPRECWVIYDVLGAPLCAYDSEDHVKSFRYQARVIHMREVME